TAIYHIRKTLEPFGANFKLINAENGYTLNLEHVLLDVEEWESQFRALPPLSDDPMKDYERLLGIYPGDYLLELDYWWAESERYRLKMLWVRIITKMADWYLTRNRY